MTRDWIVNAVRLGAEVGQAHPDDSLGAEFIKDLARFLDENPQGTYEEYGKWYRRVMAQ